MQDENRFVTLLITPAALTALFQRGCPTEEGKVLSVTLAGLPDKFRISDGCYDKDSGLFRFKVHNEHYREVPLGECCRETYSEVRLDEIEINKPWKRGREFL